MIRINLLPIRQLKKRVQNRNEIFAFIAVFCIILVGIGAWGLLISNKVKSLNETITAMTQKRDSFKPTIALMEQMKKDKKVLETKLEAIKALKKNAQITVRLLDEIAEKTPGNRLWLNSLTQRESEMLITGVALDNATLAQYMKDLSTSQYFKNAELANSSQIAVAGRKLKSFSLTLAIMPLTKEEKPADQAPDKAKEKKK